MPDSNPETSLESRVAAIETEIQHLSAAFERLSEEIGILSKRIHLSGQTNWNVFASWTTVVLLIVGSIGTLSLRPLAQDIDELKSSTILGVQQLIGHELLNAHPGAQIQFEGLKSNFRESKEALLRQDTVLQREMRDLNSALEGKIQVRIDALETIFKDDVLELQNEIVDNGLIICWKTRAERAEGK